MGADVADAAGRPAALGIGAPLRLLLPGLLQRGREPVLDVLRLHQADRPQRALGDHLPGLSDQGIAGVVVGQAEDQAARVHQRLQGLGVLQGAGQRLVADDVDAGLQEGLGGGMVQVVRRDDGDGVYAVVARRLRGRHLGEAAVGALRRQAQVRRRGPGLVGIGGERAGHQLVAVVDPGGDAVHGADEGVAPAADHAEPQAAAQSGAVGHARRPDRCRACGGWRPRRCRPRRSRRRPAR